MPQLKVMRGALDPLGMPLATLVAPGNDADDGLYIPTIRRARPAVGQEERLYIGDVKPVLAVRPGMSALETRSFLEDGGDYYLTPLPQVGEVPDLLRTLLEPVWSGKQRSRRWDSR